MPQFFSIYFSLCYDFGGKFKLPIYFGKNLLRVEYHPDKNKEIHDKNKEIQELERQLSQIRLDTEEKFKRIKTAFEVLSDPQKKRVYDQSGEDGLKKKNFN